MANYCDFVMKIVGKEEDCNKFVEKLRNYEEPNHFWRIFEATVYDRENDGDKTSLYVDGYCAWSLESCCRASGYSNGVDLLEVNTADLRLKLEAYSRELGIGFEEHYIYDKGDCIEDQCIDAEGYFWDRLEFQKYEDFKAEYPDAPPESAYEDEEEVVVGGFGDGYMVWHI